MVTGTARASPAGRSGSPATTVARAARTSTQEWYEKEVQRSAAGIREIPGDAAMGGCCC
jgi:hypothetical protein